MRTKDIIVGDDYAVCPYGKPTDPRHADRAARRATILRTKATRRVQLDWSAHNRNDGIVVRFENFSGDMETRTVIARDVIRPWADHAPIAEAIAERIAKREAESDRYTKDLLDLPPNLFPRSAPGRRVEVSLDALIHLVDQTP